MNRAANNKTVSETEEFASWFEGLKDQRARGVITARIQRLASGNPGDVKPVGQGVSELRIHHGPGYRVYYFERDGELVVLLCGGDKDSQSKDVRRAKALKKEIEKDG
ncbi:MAG: type II toxin-antitoxin system RelE/ParE family toxin [Halieaceae bacterium]|jgi:putative addiction module killer protein|nr:type II toxin-antitoxin system RelE/ParE family toxin [Halieaceae bacterium]